MNSPQPQAPSLPPHLSGLPVGADRLSHEAITAHRRQRILTAATVVFATRGYRATTTDHLAAAAKVGVGSFYALFASKEDCFLQAYDRIVAESQERIEASIDPSAAWPQQVHAALRALLKLIATEPLAARLVLVEAQTAGPAAFARYQTTLERLTSFLCEGRMHDSAGGRLPSSFEYATVTGVAWLLCERLVTGKTSGVEALLPDLVEIVLEPYLEGEAQSTPEAPGLEPDHRTAFAEVGALIAQAGTAT